MRNVGSQAAGPAVEPHLDVAGAETAEPSVIRFADALPGLEGSRSWQLIEADEARPFYWLKSADDPSLSLLVVDPRSVVPGYEPKLPSSGMSRLELEGDGAAGDETSALVLVTVTVDDRGAATLNLRAPIVINPGRMLGAQLILDDTAWPLDHPLVPSEGE